MENFYTDTYGRVWGNKAIEETVTITSLNNEIAISSTNNTYTFTVPIGTYSTTYVLGTSELVDAIKSVVQTNSYPIEVFLGGNHKDIKYNSIVFRLSNGTAISSISGTFYNSFFNSI